MPKRRKPLNKSLENALDLLELLARCAPMRSGEIALELDLKPNTANNTLRTLFHRGYVGQDEQGRYHLGPQCFFIGQEQTLMRTLRQTALPELLRLSRATGDNAFFGIESDGRLYMVAHTEGTNVIRVSEPQKWQRQFHCSAAGKVILAERGLPWLKQVSAGEPLVRRTDKTLVSDRKLDHEIKRIRAVGYAECIDEAADGIHAIGVPVRRADGTFLAALSQSFPSFYVTQGRIDVAQRVEFLQDSARTLSQRFEDALTSG